MINNRYLAIADTFAWNSRPSEKLSLENLENQRTK